MNAISPRAQNLSHMAPPGTNLRPNNNPARDLDSFTRSAEVNQEGDATWVNVGLGAAVAVGIGGLAYMMGAGAPPPSPEPPRQVQEQTVQHRETLPDRPLSRQVESRPSAPAGPRSGVVVPVSPGLTLDSNGTMGVDIGHGTTLRTDGTADFQVSPNMSVRTDGSFGVRLNDNMTLRSDGSVEWHLGGR